MFTTLATSILSVTTFPPLLIFKIFRNLDLTGVKPINILLPTFKLALLMMFRVPLELAPIPTISALKEALLTVTVVGPFAPRLLTSASITAPFLMETSVVLFGSIPKLIS